jgi:ferredoxin
MKQTSEGVKQQHNVCFSCGQCIAVCPTGALTNDHMPFSEQQARNKN